MSVFLRNPFVQVLPLEVREFGGKKPTIAFNISAMAPHFSRMEIDHPPITFLRWSYFSGLASSPPRESP